MAVQQLCKEYYMVDIPVYSEFEKKNKMTPILHTSSNGKEYRYENEWFELNGKQCLGHWILVEGK